LLYYFAIFEIASRFWQELNLTGLPNHLIRYTATSTYSKFPIILLLNQTKGADDKRMIYVISKTNFPIFQLKPSNEIYSGSKAKELKNSQIDNLDNPMLCLIFRLYCSRMLNFKSFYLIGAFYLLQLQLKSIQLHNVST